MKPGVMKQVVSAVHALKCREGVSRVELDLFLQQKFGGTGSRECDEALERAVTEGFVHLKNNRYFPRASGLPADLQVPVPIRLHMSKRASTTSTASRSAIGRGGKRKGGGRKRGRGGRREEARMEVQEARRQKRSKARRKRRVHRHNSKAVEEHEQEVNQNEGGQGGSNEEEDEGEED